MKRHLVCFQLLADEKKGALLMSAISSLVNAEGSPRVFHVSPGMFRELPGSPFCYWPSQKVLALFKGLPQFESESRMVRCGMGTLDDFRFLKCWWEVTPTAIGNSVEATLKGRKFVPYAKGGSASPFWSPIPLVINYAEDGREVKAFVEQKVGSASRKIQAQSFYFRPGLSFGRRIRRLSPTCLPSGTIFSDGSNAVFFREESRATLWRYLGLLNTRAVRALFTMCAPVRKMEVGYLQRMPVPVLGEEHAALEHCAKRGFAATFALWQRDEVTHAFVSPFVNSTLATTTLQGLAGAIAGSVAGIYRQLRDIEEDAELTAESIFGITRQDVDSAIPPTAAVAAYETAPDDVDSGDAANDGVSPWVSTSSVFSYILGAAFGRWDIRFASGDRLAHELPDPFAPLPVCPPGMLQNSQALPVEPTDIPEDYPLRIVWSGLLVDDPDHPEDIVRRVRKVLALLWGDRAEVIEQEACQILGVSELREYFRRSGKGGFWLDHVQRYSKSRRQAPIYWLLQSSRKNYALWLYYHRLDKDLLFKALVNYVEPKLRLEQARLAELRAQREAVGVAGRAAKELEKQIDRQEAFVAELHDFHDKLRRAADLHLEPDLNDGVVLNIAPLWELVPWKVAKEYWEELTAGKYEWSSIGKQLREKGKVP